MSKAERKAVISKGEEGKEEARTLRVFNGLHGQHPPDRRRSLASGGRLTATASRRRTSDDHHGSSGRSRTTSVGIFHDPLDGRATTNRSPRQGLRLHLLDLLATILSSTEQLLVPVAEPVTRRQQLLNSGSGEIGREIRVGSDGESLEGAVQRRTRMEETWTRSKKYSENGSTGRKEKREKRCLPAAAKSSLWR